MSDDEYDYQLTEQDAEAFGLGAWLQDSAERIAEALRFGVTGSSPLANTDRLESARGALGLHSERSDRLYAQAAALRSLDEPDLPEPFGARFVDRHGGDLDKALTDADLPWTVLKDLGLVGAVLVSDEDGDRYEHRRSTPELLDSAGQMIARARALLLEEGSVAPVSVTSPTPQEAVAREVGAVEVASVRRPAQQGADDPEALRVSPPTPAGPQAPPDGYSLDWRGELALRPEYTLAEDGSPMLRDEYMRGPDQQPLLRPMYVQTWAGPAPRRPYDALGEDLPDVGIVTVYSQPSCVQCTATYRELDRAGIPYKSVDISQDDAARDYVKALGHLQAPVVIVDRDVPGVEHGNHWSGYRPTAIRAYAEVIQASGVEVPQQHSLSIGKRARALTDAPAVNVPGTDPPATRVSARQMAG